MLLYSVDYKTGFYLENSSNVIWFDVILILACLIALVYTFASCRRPSKKDLPGSVDAYAPKRVMHCAIGLGLILLAAGVFAFVESVGFLIQLSQDAFAGIQNLLLVLLFAATGIFFAAIAFKSFLGHPFTQKNGLCFLIPVAALSVRLIVSFMHYTTIVNVSDNLLNILIMVSQILFLLFLTRYLSGNSTRRTKGFLLLSGLINLLFAFTLSLPRIFLLCFGPVDIKRLTAAPEWLDLCLAILALYIVLRFAVLDRKRCSSTDTSYAE